MFAEMSTSEQATWAALAAAGVVLVLAAIGLAVGLFQARSLIRREITAYFVSPIAYVVLVVFLLVTGHLFSVTFGLLTTTGPRGAEYPMRTMFGDDRFWLVFLFIPPLLTMRLFAEERSSGTLEMLMTAPLRDWQIVLSKYLACFAFYVILWIPTLAYLPALVGAQRPEFHPVWTNFSILFVSGLGALLLGLVLLLPRLGTFFRLISVVLILGGFAAAVVGGYSHYHYDSADAGHVFTIPVRFDPFPVVCTYVGMILAGAMFLALGLLVSSLVRDQMVSALVALTLGLVFIVAGFWRPQEDGSTLYQAVYFFSVPLHFDQTFTRGQLDTRPLVLYVSTTLFCLFLTVRSLESKRWQ